MPVGLKNDPAIIGRPQPDEFPGFYQGYIGLVPEGDVVTYLRSQTREFSAFLKTLSETDLARSYAPEKWTVGEVIGHIIDTERVMAYRLLRFSRKDQTPLVGFEENDYVANSNHNLRTAESLTAELEALRQANIILIANLSEEQSLLTGVANNGVISVRALVYILAGHLRHHWNILNERYLGNGNGQ